MKGLLRQRLRLPRLIRIRSSVAIVSKEESDVLVRRQIERADALEADGTRVDIEGSDRARQMRSPRLSFGVDPRSFEHAHLERGLDECPRRDGVITQPLAHHRFRWKRSKFDHFRPRPKPIETYFVESYFGTNPYPSSPGDRKFEVPVDGPSTRAQNSRAMGSQLEPATRLGVCSVRYPTQRGGARE